MESATIDRFLVSKSKDLLVNVHGQCLHWSSVQPCVGVYRFLKIVSSQLKSFIKHFYMRLFHPNIAFI